LAELNEQRIAEAARVLANMADVHGRAYEKAFNELCRLHDSLVGFAAVAEGNQGDIRLIQDPLRAPRFALPSMGSMDADPFLRHRENELTIGASARTWTAVRDRLAADAQADISDLLS
jgi:hypothetical protein